LVSWNNPSVEILKVAASRRSPLTTLTSSDNLSYQENVLGVFMSQKRAKVAQIDAHPSPFAMPGPPRVPILCNKQIEAT
jgi:hypothetical protein